MLIVDVVALQVQNILHRDGLDGVRYRTDGNFYGFVVKVSTFRSLGTGRMAHVVDTPECGVVGVVPIRISGALVNVVAGIVAGGKEEYVLVVHKEEREDGQTAEEDDVAQCAAVGVVEAS